MMVLGQKALHGLVGFWVSLAGENGLSLPL